MKVVKHKTTRLSSKVPKHDHPAVRGQVRQNTELSVLFLIITVEMKGCILASILSIIFFSMILKKATKDFDDEDGLYIRYHLDSSQFNFWWL